jgi:hypothetical protein
MREFCLIRGMQDKLAHSRFDLRFDVACVDCSFISGDHLSFVFKGASPLIATCV